MDNILDLQSGVGVRVPHVSTLWEYYNDGAGSTPVWATIGKEANLVETLVWKTKGWGS